MNAYSGVSFRFPVWARWSSLTNGSKVRKHTILQTKAYRQLEDACGPELTIFPMRSAVTQVSPRVPTAVSNSNSLTTALASSPTPPATIIVLRTRTASGRLPASPLARHACGHSGKRRPTGTLTGTFTMDGREKEFRDVDRIDQDLRRTNRIIVSRRHGMQSEPRVTGQDGRHAALRTFLSQLNHSQLSRRTSLDLARTAFRTSAPSCRPLSIRQSQEPEWKIALRDSGRLVALAWLLFSYPNCRLHKTSCTLPIEEPMHEKAKLSRVSSPRVRSTWQMS